jgi:CMP-N-acetylneuraminic acid synthetase
MICALMIGRAGSRGFPNKNIAKVLGKKLCEYPLLAAKNSLNIDSIYISTDCPEIKKIGQRHKVEIIDRPKSLATNEALGEEVFKHGYLFIKDLLKSKNESIELMVLLFANAPTVTSQMIDEGIKILRSDTKVDSAVSTSVYNMWSPLRARRVDEKGLLKPFVPFETFGDPKTLNCDRDSQGEVHFADMSVSVVRPNCLENLSNGLLPQKWMGNNIKAIKSWGGCDVDYEWQIPSVEYWLKKNKVNYEN